MLAEFLYREKYGTDQVLSFMAGGDVALVHSLEGFEDYPELGARHLMQMGFTEKDLLISSTEGGETPFVIGATEKAAEVSRYKPYFLFCNPREILGKKVERSKRVFENPNIVDLCLFVGPMALSGSTRMQASTVLQMALGCAFIEVDDSVENILKEFFEELVSCDFSKLARFTDKEFGIYKKNEFVMYVPHHFAITVFTDTTERSPTFSLPSFENDQYQGEAPSLCYILIPTANSAPQAWLQLLKREPQALDWSEIDPRTSSPYLESFDFSKNSLNSRADRLRGKEQHFFDIESDQESIKFSLSKTQSFKTDAERSFDRSDGAYGPLPVQRDDLGETHQW